MELYATGGNQWLQLSFGKQKEDGKHQEEDPDDLWEFTCVFRHDGDIHTIQSFDSYNVVYQKQNNSFITKAGRVPPDHNVLRSVDENIYRTFAEANNGHVAVYNPSTATITEYLTIQDLLLDIGSEPIPETQPVCKISFTGFPDIIQLLSYSTGFAALSSSGQVYTWGDERYAGCLGREVTNDCPASRPCPVPLLCNLPTGPINHLTTSPQSYLLACLTEGNDLYVWCDPRRLPPSLQTLFVNQEANDAEPNGPTPVVITDAEGNEVDGIVDVAVGAEHVIALTDRGEVYVIGENGSGQLGLGEGVEFVMEWTRVPLRLGEEGGDRTKKKKKVVESVKAGAWASFLVVGEEEK
ncbi:regulator of chromosome condensation 1/beta-lactamase-inhibitor protein II [Sordaria brevicollis]|uniref:Regulator of chromosome condensation 1/beta-lactamase-inhibitor protein II n=1 Tax=Sordaria brevicollis TaxID=83679 RepID=A0AAE0UB90_SORBR|nr:regulator of chromosome condensation 1/beta-lactamase-inhibitor protein II [Sordaria brevicollis]